MNNHQRQLKIQQQKNSIDTIVVNKKLFFLNQQIPYVFVLSDSGWVDYTTQLLNISTISTDEINNFPSLLVKYKFKINITPIKNITNIKNYLKPVISVKTEHNQFIKNNYMMRTSVDVVPATISEEAYLNGNKYYDSVNGWTGPIAQARGFDGISQNAMYVTQKIFRCLRGTDSYGEYYYWGMTNVESQVIINSEFVGSDTAVTGPIARFSGFAELEIKSFAKSGETLEEFITNLPEPTIELYNAGTEYTWTDFLTPPIIENTVTQWFPGDERCPYVGVDLYNFVNDFKSLPGLEGIITYKYKPYPPESVTLNNFGYIKNIYADNNNLLNDKQNNILFETIDEQEYMIIEGNLIFDSFNQTVQDVSETGDLIRYRSENNLYFEELSSEEIIHNVLLRKLPVQETVKIKCELVYIPNNHQNISKDIK